MANTNSNIVDIQDGTTTTKLSVAKFGGRVRIAADNFELVAANFDADGDTIHLCNLPVNAVIHSIKVSTDDLDTGATVAFNYGIYSTDLGTIKDEDFFATAVTAQAASTLTEIYDEAAAAGNVAGVGDPLWQNAGDTSDPGGQYAIVATATAANAGAQAGTFAFQILYSID